MDAIEALNIWADKIAQRDARIAGLESELLRVRTTGHGAAHELDNIAVECGLGHSPKPGEVAAHVRQLREAVRVLGEFAYWQDGDNAVRHLTSDKKLDYVNKIIYKTWSAIYANPIASAAIKAATDAGKAREP